MQANLNKTIAIKAEDVWCYHLKVESRAVDPRDPTHPRINRRILILSPDNYKKYFQCSVTEQIGYLKAMGLENVELVHDPTLERTVRIEFPKSAEQIRLEKKVETKIKRTTIRSRKPSER